jgi:hypothetical protein
MHKQKGRENMIHIFGDPTEIGTLDTLVPCPRFPNVCPLPPFLRREGKVQIPESRTTFNTLCLMQQGWSRAAAAVSVDSIDGARKLNACWVALYPESSDLI